MRLFGKSEIRIPKLRDEIRKVKYISKIQFRPEVSGFEFPTPYLSEISFNLANALGMLSANIFLQSGFVFISIVKSVLPLCSANV